VSVVGQSVANPPRLKQVSVRLIHRWSKINRLTAWELIPVVKKVPLLYAWAADRSVKEVGMRCLQLSVARA
jgi:hypothetical protein